MAGDKSDGETKADAAERDDKLVSRAAKRADWAGSALEGAADDLTDVGEDDTDSMTGLAEVVQDEAEKVSRLAKDIESQRSGTDREPEAWETSAAGPFLTIGEVAVWALGDQRFRVQSPAGDEEIEGFAEAQQRAHELAEKTA